MIAGNRLTGDLARATEMRCESILAVCSDCAFVCVVADRIHRGQRDELQLDF